MSRLDEIYDAKFYQENLDNREAYDRLGDAIHAVIPTGPVFDVGSGAGLVLARLHQLGHRVRGVEGSRHGIAATPLEVRSRITHGDVTDLPTYFAETAICVEVAEHLPSSAADALVSAVASVADSAIVWSAAHEGQGGTDHVNEQPPGYWLERFAAEGWAPDDVRTQALRALITLWHAQHHYCVENFYLLVTA